MTDTIDYEAHLDEPLWLYPLRPPWTGLRVVTSRDFAFLHIHAAHSDAGMLAVREDVLEEAVMSLVRADAPCAEWRSLPGGQALLQAHAPCPAIVVGGDLKVYAWTDLRAACTEFVPRQGAPMFPDMVVAP